MGKRKSRDARLGMEPEGDDHILYVEVEHEGDWLRIAKRYSGGRWISLEPGFTVRGSEPGTDYDTIEIEYTPANAMPQ